MISSPPVGETHTGVCPFCSGGRTQEISFAVTNTGSEILYICHRASCGKKGRYPVDGVCTEVISKPRFKPQIRTPSKKDLEELVGKYGLTSEELSRLRPSLCTNAKERRWYYPIWGPHGSNHGGVARSLEGVRPKVLSCKDEDYHLGSWYLHPSGVECVALVEDQVSAARLSGQITTVALMGTHLCHELLMFLAKHVKHLYIVLDSDAHSKAVSLATRIAPYFHSVTVVPIDKDIKNNPEFRMPLR